MTRILIVDDHEVVRAGLRAILELQPEWEVVADAADGPEAISKAVKTQPDVAVVDYSLPLLNGIETTRQIRSRVPHTEVLIFTMHESDVLVRDLLQAGARGYLLKSDAKQFLIEAITALAAHKPFFTGKVSEKLLKSFLVTAGDTEGGALTARERSVVQLIAEGGSNKQIASTLSISQKTLETHRSAVMRKLGVNSAAALVRYAIRNRIIEA